MTPTTTKTETLTEWTYYPFMCLWVSMKKGGTKAFYSRELINSLKQIANRDNLPKIDLPFGYQGLINLAEETLIGQYHKAIIYGVSKDNIAPGKRIREYYNNKVTVYQEPNFNSDLWLQYKDNLINRLVDKCRSSDIIISVFDPENPIIIKR